MKKIILMLVTFGITTLFLCSCSTENSISNERKNALKKYDNIFSEIIDYLEEGEYGDANTLIKEEINGNIILENEARDVFYDYTNAMYDDYNNGELDTEKIKVILAAGARTDYASYFEMAEFRINNLMESKMQFQKGKDAYALENYELALIEWEYVNQSDTNYPETISLSHEILKEFLTSTKMDDQRLAASTADKLQSVISLGDIAVEKEYISKENMIQLMSDCSKAYFAFATALENKDQLWHAAQQYARAYVVAKTIYDGLNGYKEYKRIMHHLHPAYITPDNGYYKSDEIGTFFSYGETSSYFWYSKTLEVLTFEWSDSCFSAVIGTDGKVKITETEWSVSRPGNNEFVNSINNYETDALAIDVFVYYDALFALYSDGTVKVFPYPEEENKIFTEVEQWSDIVQIVPAYKGILGLKSNGTVVATSGISQFAYSDLFDFKGVVELSTGLEHHQLFGYYGQFYMEDEEYFIKLHDGSAKYMEAHAYLQDDYYDTYVPSYNCPNEMLDFYGGFYLTPDGKIRFVFDKEDKYLQEYYADSTYIKLSGPDKYFDFYNCVAAWTSDTEFEIIYIEENELLQMED